MFDGFPEGLQKILVALGTFLSTAGAGKVYLMYAKQKQEAKDRADTRQASAAETSKKTEIEVLQGTIDRLESQTSDLQERIDESWRQINDQRTESVKALDAQRVAYEAAISACRDKCTACLLREARQGERYRALVEQHRTLVVRYKEVMVKLRDSPAWRDSHDDDGDYGRDLQPPAAPDGGSGEHPVG